MELHYYPFKYAANMALRMVVVKVKEVEKRQFQLLLFYFSKLEVIGRYSLN